MVPPSGPAASPSTAGSGAPLAFDDLELDGSPESESGDEPPTVALGDDLTLGVIEREHIAHVIARSPTLDAAAKVLGIDRSTLNRKRKQYGLM